MIENQEISVACSFITDSMMLNFLTTEDGERFAVISTEIAVPVEELASLMGLINAKHVTLKATPSV